MKLSWTIVLVTSLFSSHSLLAADAQYCDQYVKTSIKHQLSNITADCKQKGNRWSTLYVGQNAWCRTVSKKIADNETKVRNGILVTCGAPLSKEVWKTAGNSNAAYYLFAQMQAATKKDDLVSVKFMQSQGVMTSDPSGDNDGGILYLAVDHQAEKVAQYWLDQGKSPSSIPNGGGNALSAMIKDPKINYRMLAMLLKRGFDPNYGGEGYSDEYFPVMQAAKKNKPKALQMLIKAGGDVNMSRDNTPLIYAIKNRNMSMVETLIKAGAKVNQPGNIDNCTFPMDVAMKSGSRGLITLLKSKGAKQASCS